MRTPSLPPEQKSCVASQNFSELARGFSLFSLVVVVGVVGPVVVVEVLVEVSESS